MQGRPTLADVARAAGVSTGAVSLILRESGRFSESTRQRVKEAARRLDYRPNPVLSSYKTGKFRSKRATTALPLAFVFRGGGPCPDSTRERAEELGYRLENHELEEGEDPRRLGDILYARGVRGILLGQLYGCRSLPDLGWERFACVCVSRPFFQVPFDVIRHRIVEDFLHAFEQARERGYRRIGFDVQIHRSWGQDHPDDRARYAAALYCQEQLPEKDRLPIHRSRASENETFREWIREHRPDAVVGGMGHRRRDIEAVGLKVPDEVGFVALIVHGSEPGSSETGFLATGANESLRAVEVLDQCIRRNLFGPRPDPMEHLVARRWREGATLPGRRNRR